MFTELYKQAASGTMEAFSSGSGHSNAPLEVGAVAAIVAFLTVLVLLAIQLVAVQWLWNHVLTRVVIVAKPMNSMFEALGLLVLSMLLLP